MLLLSSVNRSALLLLMLSLAGPLAVTASGQEQTSADQIIDGARVPKGVTRAFVEAGKQFAEEMIRNYKRYLELKETAKQRKQKGEALTTEETEVDAIKTYAELDQWIAKQKRKEGHNLVPAGHTDVFNNVQTTTPPPKTPDEDFVVELTWKIHEPSHVAANLERAEWVVLTWDEVEELGKIKAKKDADQALTKDENDYFAERESRWQDYLKLCDDPVESALEEIAEYEAENRVRDKVLKTMSSAGPRRRRFE